MIAAVIAPEHIPQNFHDLSLSLVGGSDFKRWGIRGLSSAWAYLKDSSIRSFDPLIDRIIGRNTNGGGNLTQTRAYSRFLLNSARLNAHDDNSELDYHSGMSPSALQAISTRVSRFNSAIESRSELYQSRRGSGISQVVSGSLSRLHDRFTIATRWLVGAHLVTALGCKMLMNSANKINTYCLARNTVWLMSAFFSRTQCDKWHRDGCRISNTDSQSHMAYFDKVLAVIKSETMSVCVIIDASR